MKKTKKTLLMSLAAILLISVGVFGTLAYLTSTTDTVKNTFTVGRVDITLDEAKVDEFGKIIEGENAGRHLKNSYKLIPGTTYDKDPTVHVLEGSEESWLFVELKNTLEEFILEEQIETQMIENGWIPVNEAKDIWRQENIVTAGKDYILFTKFTIKEEVAKEVTVEPLTVKAFAIQAENLTAEGAFEKVSFE